MSGYTRKVPRFDKEKRPVFKKIGARGVSDEAGKTPILDCDNRRSHDAGYVHDVELTTASALWDYLQKEVKIRDDAKLHEEIKKLLEYRNHLSIRDSFREAMFANTSGYEPLLADSFIKSSIPIDFFTKREISFRGRSYDYDFSPYFDGNFSLDLSKYFFSIHPLVSSTAVPPVSFEKHEAFLRKAQWQYHGRNNLATSDSDASWRELQDSLEPSLLDEDVLGGFGDWLEYFPPDNQFLLIGDTNHNNSVIKEWIVTGDYIPSLASNGFTDLVIERTIDLKDDIKAFYSGEASKDQIAALLVNGILELCKQARKHGIQIHALDRQIDAASPGKILPFRHRNDERLAEDIKKAVGDKKTAVIYGSAHFSYKNGLYDSLARSNCRVVNLHEGFKDYQDPVVKQNATYPAAYVFLLEQQTVIASRGNYLRKLAPANDSYLTHSVLPTEREKEISKFRERFDSARSVNPKKYQEFTVEDIVFRFENPLQIK